MTNILRDGRPFEAIPKSTIFLGIADKMYVQVFKVVSSCHAWDVSKQDQS